MYFLVSYSFNLGSYYDSALAYVLVIALLTATSNLATGIPSAVGGIGPFEVVAQQTLIALGVGATVAGALLRLRTLGSPVAARQYRRACHRSHNPVPAEPQSQAVTGSARGGRISLNTGRVSACNRRHVLPCGR